MPLKIARPKKADDCGVRWLSVDDLVALREDLPVYPGTGKPHVPSQADNERFAELVRLVSQRGLAFPIFAVQGGNEKTPAPPHRVVSGHYAYWAAREAGLTTVPVVFVRSLAETLDWLER